MPTIQVWATEDDMETLRRVKEFLEHQVEKEFEGKAWRMSPRRRKRKRIRRPEMNYTYIYREALNLFWGTNEQQITAFEKSKKYR